MRLLSKKAQIDQLAPIVITLVAVGIVLVIGFLIFAQAKNNVILDNIDTNTVNNEGFVWSNNTFVALTYSGSGVAELTCSRVINGSGGLLIGSGNYTCNPNGINLVNNPGSTWNTTVELNYTYKNTSRAWNATTTTQNATQNIPGWLSLIVITIIGSLLIGLVGLFRGR